MTLIARLRARLRHSVRFRLLFLGVAPLLAVAPIMLAALLYWGDAAYHNLLVFKINSDLKIAHEYFERVLSEVGGQVKALAYSGRLLRDLQNRDTAAARALLAAEKASLDVDFLNVLDANGRLVLSSSDQAQTGTDASAWPVVRAALAGEERTAIDVFSADQLSALDLRLRDQARIPVLPRDGATEKGRKLEERGLVIQSAAPIRDENGRLTGVLQGGLLLNANLDFVDYINSIVYSAGSLPPGSSGTATLFLGDVRIATNVRLFEGGRALGTRAPQRVFDHVIRDGGVWLDRAFVVNDWYVSAYEPIRDSEGRRVGMLYVGFLEQPFSAARTRALLGIMALFLLTALIAAAFFWRWAGRIFRPLERIDQTMSAVEAGNLDARVGPVESRDEIGRLALHFDALLATLQSRNAELQRWGEQLDRKVSERTRELEQASENLREAQRQLVMSEKLAAIGELTAGVAHEINNPTAVIQGNLDLLREVLGPAAAPVANEVRLIDEQVNRIRLIVTKLLQFARPDEYAGYVEQVEVNALLADCLVLVRHLMHQGYVKVVEEFGATRRIAINRNELQQVLINILVNAIRAMPDGGVLVLSTRDWEEQGVAVVIRDTGLGIRPDDLPRIFDPFFTTNHPEGTGLGLSVSYALVERYGGSITVRSQPGQGAEFTVWLLSKPAFPGNGGGVPETVSSPPV
jgi:two-component system NtrC family sensor kinase